MDIISTLWTQETIILLRDSIIIRDRLVYMAHRDTQIHTHTHTHTHTHAYHRILSTHFVCVHNAYIYISTVCCVHVIYGLYIHTCILISLTAGMVMACGLFSSS